MVSPESHHVVDLPEGVTATLKGNTLTVKGKNGELTRDFRHPDIGVKVEGNKVVLHADLPRRKVRALVGTWSAHIRNMVEGAQQDFEYKMKICYSHFPIKTKIQGEIFLVENFVGERTARKARIMGKSKVKVSGEEVLVTGANLEDVSQTAANIEQSCLIRGFDTRVFQDGIYIINKGA